MSLSERKPGIYIPSLYFVEGLPYTMVNMMSVVFLKNLGAANEFIGWTTSLLSLPWIAKALWAILVDVYSTRRNWILVSHVVLAMLSGAIALGALAEHAVAFALVGMALMAFVSATQDVAIDGFYLDALSKEKQAFFVGIRNAAYKVAWLFGSGGLVYLAGKAGESLGVGPGWSIAFAVCAALFLALALFHAWYLPDPPRGARDADAHGLSLGAFKRMFSTYFNQPGIAAIVLYILIFRLGDAFMLKMAQPFLLDPLTKGGLGMSTADVGLVYGTAGMIFLLLGGIVGGWLVSKYGLSRCLWPTALIQNGAILLYFLLAVTKPGLAYVAVANACEQFSYGLGVSAYTVFLLGTVKPEFKAAHYAIATAMMAIGLMLPGALSGFMTKWLSYPMFFLVSFLASIPGLITISFLPLKEEKAS